MARRRRRSFSNGIVTLLTIFFLEAASVAAMFTDLPVGPVVDLLLAFAFHLGAACVVSYGFWGPWDFRYAEDKNWAAIGFVLVLAIPVYGLLGYAGAYGAVHWRRSMDLAGSDVIGQFEQYIAYEPALESRMHRLSSFVPPVGASRLASDAERRNAVAPLIDVIRSGPPSMKRGAIFSLSRLDRKVAVKILRESLYDVDAESQYYVAGQLGQIEKELSDRIIRTQRVLELEPDNTEMKVRLQRQCKDYVESGLLEPSVERYFVRQAVDLCNQVVEEDGERVDVLVDMAELLHRRGDLVDSIATYRRVLRSEPQSTGARLGLAHCYFTLRDMGNLRTVLDELDQLGTALPDDLDAVLEFWRADDERAAEGDRA